jgi:hypothetical protein
VKMIAATMSRSFVRFPLKTRHNRPGNLRLPPLRGEKTRTYTGRHRTHFLLQERHNHGRLSSFS